MIPKDCKNVKLSVNIPTQNRRAKFSLYLHACLNLMKKYERCSKKTFYKNKLTIKMISEKRIAHFTIFEIDFSDNIELNLNDLL